MQKTLHEEGLVDEFAPSYAACFESVPERILYCEHGEQFDPANIIKGYGDPLDTPLGDHIVTDLTRGLVSAGRITMLWPEYTRIWAPGVFDPPFWNR